MSSSLRRSPVVDESLDGSAFHRHREIVSDAGPTLLTTPTPFRAHLDAMVVTDAGTVTAGAAFAHVDLALALVRQASPALAEHVARLLVIDERAAQSRYLAVDHLGHDDPLVLALEQYARAHMHEPFDVHAAATAIGTSRRTLERRTRAVLGCSPLELVQRLRIERASHLLRTTGQNVDQIAPLVGYANASTLRTLLRRSARTSGTTEPRRRAPR
jgi:transcriptional regulator GlxA family with amidase domain